MFEVVTVPGGSFSSETSSQSPLWHFPSISRLSQSSRRDGISELDHTHSNIVIIRTVSNDSNTQNPFKTEFSSEQCKSIEVNSMEKASSTVCRRISKILTRGKKRMDQPCSHSKLENVNLYNFLSRLSNCFLNRWKWLDDVGLIYSESDHDFEDQGLHWSWMENNTGQIFFECNSIETVQSGQTSIFNFERNGSPENNVPAEARHLWSDEIPDRTRTQGRSRTPRAPPAKEEWCWVNKSSFDSLFLFLTHFSPKSSVPEPAQVAVLSVELMMVGFRNESSKTLVSVSWRCFRLNL
jgi:hypothetical protein